MLEVDQISKAFGGVQAVSQVSFRVEPGEHVALIGPNGAGKTTCFNLLNGYLRPDSGRIRLHGQDVVGRSPQQCFRLGMGRTFQVAQTFASMTVVDNVEMVIQSRQGRLGSLWSQWGRCREEAVRILDRVGLKDQADRLCSILAYGDLKRVELAMALAGQPNLLLMDEPTAGLPPAHRQQLMTLITEVARRDQMSLLFTEHDMDVVFTYAHRILVLHQGRVLADGHPSEVQADPNVHDTYLRSSSP